MHRGDPESDAAPDGELLMEEEGEWMVALKAALVPRPPRLGETGGQPKGRQRGSQAYPRAAADQRGPEEAGAGPGEGDSSPHRGRGRRPRGCCREEASPP